MSLNNVCKLITLVALSVALIGLILTPIQWGSTGAPSVADIIVAFHAGGIEVSDFVSPARDPNSLLPNSYLERIEFKDAVLGDKGGQVFVCDTKRNCDAIYAYFDALKSLAGPYLYQPDDGLAVVQLDRGFTPAQADRYAKILRGESASIIVVVTASLTPFPSVRIVHEPLPLAAAATPVVAGSSAPEAPLHPPTATPMPQPMPTYTASPVPTETQQPTATNTLPPTPTNTSVPTSTPVPTNTPVPTDTPRPTPTPFSCECSHDAYRCDDFSYDFPAQMCFNYCNAQGADDIHRLDHNNNGVACESN